MPRSLFYGGTEGPGRRQQPISLQRMCEMCARAPAGHMLGECQARGIRRGPELTEACGLQRRGHVRVGRLEIALRRSARSHRQRGRTDGRTPRDANAIGSRRPRYRAWRPASGASASVRPQSNQITRAIYVKADSSLAFRPWKSGASPDWILKDSSRLGPGRRAGPDDMRPICEVDRVRDWWLPTLR